MDTLKEQILELCEDAQFDNSLDGKLFGCAEMFGESCILLYEGENFIRYSSPADCMEKIAFYSPNSLKMEEFNGCLIGHLRLDDGSIRLVYDKDAILKQLKEEYMADDTGLFNGEEDCELSAMEHYEYNILGSYMDGIPVFAIIYSH